MVENLNSEQGKGPQRDKPVKQGKKKFCVLYYRPENL